MSDMIIVSYMIVLNRVVVASLDVGGNRTSRDWLENVLVVHCTDRYGGDGI
jgi:hypothetical protein